MRPIIEKLWDSHVVHEQPGNPTLLFIDLHLVHEDTSPQAFDVLRMRSSPVQDSMKVNRSALITSAWVVGIPWGNPG